MQGDRVPNQMPRLDAPADRYQLSLKSLHEGHNPDDLLVAMIEEMAIDQCGACAQGLHRWRDRQSGQFCHPDEFGYEAEECEANNTLRIAIDHGVPIYTGAELDFEDDEAEAGKEETGGGDVG